VLAANNIMQQQMAPFHCCQGVISAACVWFMVGVTSYTDSIVHRVIREILQVMLTVRCGRFTLEGGVTVRQVHVASDNLRPDW